VSIYFVIENHNMSQGASDKVSTIDMQKLLKRASCIGIHVLLYALLVVLGLNSVPSMSSLALNLRCTLGFVFVSS
jgi:hypothetical protein